MKRRKPDELIVPGWQQLELVNSWIRHSDAKLTTLLAFIGVAGGGLYAVVQEGCRPAALIPLALLSAVFLGGAATSAFLGLIPVRRFKASDAREVIFYRAIASKYLDPAAYIAAFECSITDEDLGPNLLRQALINAKIADRKFVLTTWSGLLLMGGLAALAVCAGIRVIG
ncbi:Pycsar system effector family protein [Curtobacterium sp. SP.BCp]|uniref:Pycsar system effector family protein n=1 Tax=Curtobacterium sp. SP.BCp TaxID=3435230 RepID=UPI003F73D45A